MPRLQSNTPPVSQFLQSFPQPFCFQQVCDVEIHLTLWGKPSMNSAAACQAGISSWWRCWCEILSLTSCYTVVLTPEPSAALPRNECNQQKFGWKMKFRLLHLRKVQESCLCCASVNGNISRSQSQPWRIGGCVELAMYQDALWALWAELSGQGWVGFSPEL